MTAQESPTGKATTTAQRADLEPNGESPPGASDPLRKFSALSGDWFWVQDAQLRLTYMSSRLGEHAGLDLAAYLGANRWEQPALNLTVADWERHRAQVERHEPFKDFEIHTRADDGRTVWLALSGQPLLDEEGNFSGYLGVGRDITAQKRIAELRELEHRMARALGESANASEALSDVLQALRESDGWQHAELRRDGVRPGVGLAGMVWQSGEPLWIGNTAEDPRAGGAFAPDLRALVLFPVTHRGRTLGVLELGSPAVRSPEARFLDTLQALSHQLGALLDRASLDEARRQAEQRFRSISQLSADWYWEIDANYAFTRLEGRHVAGGDTDLARRLIGIRRWESGLEVEGGWDAHRALLDARKPFHDVLMWRALPDGQTRYMSISGEPLLNADGTFTGYHGVGRDVTLQKRSERMLRLEHEVARALAAAHDMAAGLKAVVLALCEAEGWDSGRYFRVEQGGLRFQDGWCLNEPAIDQFIERARKLWQSGKAAWSAEASRAVPPPSSFIFPVISEGNAIGVLAFTGRASRAPDERLQQAARVIGSHVGQFLHRKQAESFMREGEERFRSLTQMSSDFFWETDAEHRFRSVVNGPHYAAADVSGGLVGKRPWEIESVSPDEAGWAAYRASLDSHQPFRDFEFARAMPDGSTRYFSLSGEPRLAVDGSFLGYRGVGRDVTESALTRERIASLAYRDALTGLANRTSLAPALEQAVERARRRGFKLAGVFIDLDGFKQINDLYGHDAGDRCLMEVARRLRGTVRASDVVARLGGDEFFVLLEEVQDETAVESVIRKLLAEAVRPFELPEGAQARLSASMGVALFPDDASDAAALIKLADTAMYAAKQAGKNRYALYSATRGPSSAGPDGAAHAAQPPEMHSPPPLPSAREAQ